MVILINNYILICFQFYFYFLCVFLFYFFLIYCLSIFIQKKIDYKFSLKINNILYHTILKYAKENE